MKITGGFPIAKITTSIKRNNAESSRDLARGQGQASSRGLTLIEMLLGIMIFATLSACLYSVYAAGVKVNEQSDQSLKILREARWVLEEMTRDFGNIARYDFGGSYPREKSYVVNDAALEILVKTDQGLKAVRYVLRPLDEEKIHTTRVGVTTRQNVAVTTIKTQGLTRMALVREEQDFRRFLQNGFNDATSEILSRSVLFGGMKIFQAGAGRPGEKNITWISGWSKDVLPKAVRIELTLVSGKTMDKATFAREMFIPTGEWHE
jgi:type II secretion system protein J